MSEDKFAKVRELLRGKRVLVAFSGGVDSTVLAKIAEQESKEVLLLNVIMPTAPSFEAQRTESIAEEIGAPLEIVTFDWLGHDKLVANDEKRCYLCKLEIGKLWLEVAKKREMDLVIEGTTATEIEGHRPGAQALRELEILSPFLEAGITKEEIRDFARQHNLSIAELPSMACLASRFPTNTQITAEKLRMVDNLENAVRKLFDVECVRVRYHEGLARIEVGKEERNKLFGVQKLDEIHKIGVAIGFKYITFDVRGYQTGSTS
ncbi:MAG: hypothetical protein BAJATHORv1_10215 [Candidatus Thorarchaeota archaeon]|nr:MAG: hypothetical protein BAJATHORv1_10215 [Candidatus Thorarchaeota archaeon]